MRYGMDSDNINHYIWLAFALLALITGLTFLGGCTAKAGLVNEIQPDTDVGDIGDHAGGDVRKDTPTTQTGGEGTTYNTYIKDGALTVAMLGMVLFFFVSRKNAKRRESAEKSREAADKKAEVWRTADLATARVLHRHAQQSDAKGLLGEIRTERIDAGLLVGSASKALIDREYKKHDVFEDVSEL